MDLLLEGSPPGAPIMVSAKLMWHFDLIDNLSRIIKRQFVDKSWIQCKCLANITSLFAYMWLLVHIYVQCFRHRQSEGILWRPSKGWFREVLFFILKCICHANWPLYFYLHSFYFFEYLTHHDTQYAHNTLLSPYGSTAYS